MAGFRRDGHIFVPEDSFIQVSIENPACTQVFIRSRGACKDICGVNYIRT